MLLSESSSFKSSVVACLFLIVSGCGKKVGLKEVNNEVERPTQTQIDTYLSQQDVNCEPNRACPNYIAKLVIVNGESFKFCTGFLINDKTIATSSSCLPGLLRLQGQDCGRDIFFFFPKTSNRPAQKATCKRVISASVVDGKDPLMWRDDVAYLELNSSIFYRRQANISRDGLQNNREYTTWMIDQQDGSSALVKRINCNAIHGSYINPLAANESSPNMIFGNCPITRGGAGAPLLDNRGKVRGMISKGMDSGLRNYLVNTGMLLNPLSEIGHGTNFACAMVPGDIDVLDEKECYKDLNYNIVDRLRGEMVSTKYLFSELRKNYEDSIQSISSKMKLGVKLLPNGDIYETEIFPKCFRPLDGWLDQLSSNRNTYVDSLSFPVKSFRRAMDSFGRILAITLESEEKEISMQFSLKTLRNTKKSSILIWANGEDQNVRTYNNMTENCESLLF